MADLPQLRDAHDAVREMCKGERFRMSIPVDPKRDHDVRITRSLMWAARRIAALEGALRGVADAILETGSTVPADPDTIVLSMSGDVRSRVLDALEDVDLG